jgi:hypothetical protein
MHAWHTFCGHHKEHVSLPEPSGYEARHTPALQLTQPPCSQAMLGWE